MDKMKMAHEYALEMAKQGIPLKSCKELGWKYADAMQAEAEKRKPSGLPDALKKEWQPDWSQAPEWAKWWAMDGFSNKANWYYSTPYLDEDSDGEYEWNIELRPNGETYSKAPSFNYQGNWKDSLRERPHGF